ncbi:MAG: type II toxin-antitoxin system HicA family toxin [Rhizobiales bacterium]|nr:type II toxin-antitoxin system HicA family toxin [Hyphomicrobiales bacterium]
MVGDFGAEVRRRLRAAGCVFKRMAKGDHELWYSPINGRSFVVDGKIKSRHSANAIMKQAGLPKSF